MIPKIAEHRNDMFNLRLISILFFKKILEDHPSKRNDLQTMLVKMIMTNLSTVLFMFLLYAGVQFIKLKKKTKKKYQLNIVTFNQNFYFYLTYCFINLLLTLVRLNVLKFATGEKAEVILIFSYMIKLFSVWLIRPTIIVMLLKKNIPDFFEDFDSNNLQQAFKSNFSGQTIFPREQKFLEYKPFGQNARWGSESKFQTLNVATVNQCKKMNHRGKSVRFHSPISKIVMMPVVHL